MIVQLLNRLGNIEKTRQFVRKQPEDSNNSGSAKAAKQQNAMEEGFRSTKKAHNIQFSSNGSLPINQFKDFILGLIKDKYEGSNKSSFVYVKSLQQKDE